MANLDPEHLTNLVDKWRDRLGVGPHWTIVIKLAVEKGEVKRRQRGNFAFTGVDEAYFQADITFCAWNFEDKDDDYVDLVACHEVLHIVLHKLEHLAELGLGDDDYLHTILTENVVETISRALCALQSPGGR